jgi:outer membrane protein, heavy metal efflux system
MYPLRNYHLLLILASACVSACADLPFVAKPLEPQNSLVKLQQKSPSNPDFLAYLHQQNYQQALPFKAWGLDELTYSALFFHPDLALAKSKLSLALANAEVAGLKSAPNISAQLAHSNQANGDKQPWAYGLQVEIPITTNNKHAIKVEQAQYLTQAAKMDVAETAWKLREQLKTDLITHAENIESIKQTSQQLAIYQKLSALYQSRLSQGLSSSTEVSRLQLQKQKVQFELTNLQANTTTILAKLASDAGLSVEQFSTIPLPVLDVSQLLKRQNQALTIPTQKLQEEALLNRIDIRRSIAQYAAAETNIKLEVAKQRPDISLTPGIAFEFGDSLWSLGFSTLLNLLNQHPTYIKQAEQLRAVEGAQFEALQSAVVGDLAQAYSKYLATQDRLAQSKIELATQQALQQKLQKQFDAGLIDRVDLTHASLNTQNAEQMQNAITFELLRAQTDIENIMQRPLNSSSGEKLTP